VDYIRYNFNEGGYLFTFTVFRNPFGWRMYFGPGRRYWTICWWPCCLPRCRYATDKQNLTTSREYDIHIWGPQVRSGVLTLGFRETFRRAYADLRSALRNKGVPGA
jgi:hypothetical protein